MKGAWKQRTCKAISVHLISFQWKMSAAELRAHMRHSQTIVLLMADWERSQDLDVKAQPEVDQRSYAQQTQAYLPDLVELRYQSHAALQH